MRDLKTHAAGIVRRVREKQASYVLTHRGRSVGVILPLGLAAHEEAAADGGASAWAAFLRAGRRVEKGFQTGRSGVQLLSAMRR